MRPTLGLVRTLVCGLAVLSLAACGEDPGPGPGANAASDGASPSASAPSAVDPMPSAPPTPRPYRAVCAGADPLAVGLPAPVDAALGRRFLLVQVRNCSDAPITSPVPSSLRATAVATSSSWR